MNKVKEQMEKRSILNQIRFNSLSGNKEGFFYCYMSETWNHINKKFLVWYKLRKAGYEVWTEPIFDTGIRFDILAFKDGIWTGYEILETETDKELSEKIKKYPSEVTIIKIKTQKDIDNLELI